MYIAGTIDFSNDGASNISKENVLKFPVRIPFERIPQFDNFTNNTDNKDLVIKAPFISNIATGQRHMLCVINNVLYGLGCNKHLQLGRSIPPTINYFKEINFKNNLSNTGSSRLSIRKNNSKKEMNDDNDSNLRSCGVDKNSLVKQIVCGRKHSMILTDNDELFVSGDNEFSQLGIGPASAVGESNGDWRQVQINLFNANNNNSNEKCSIKAIAAGLETSYALMNNGTVYSWGCGKTLALGHPLSILDVTDPKTMLPYIRNIDYPLIIETFIKRQVKIFEIAAGNEHFVCRGGFCSFSGDGYGGIGNNRVKIDERLGSELKRRRGENLTAILDENSINNLNETSINEKNGSAAIKAVVEAGYGGDLMEIEGDEFNDIYVCGLGSFGRCGNGSTRDQPTPALRVEFPYRATPEKVKQIAAGAQVTYVLKHSPEFGSIVYVWGRENGPSSSDCTMLPRIITAGGAAVTTNITRIFCNAGSFLAFAITEEADNEFKEDSAQRGSSNDGSSIGSVGRDNKIKRSNCSKLLAWGQHNVVPNLLLLNDKIRRVPSNVELLNHVCVKQCCTSGGFIILISVDIDKTLHKMYKGDVKATNNALLKNIIVPYEKRDSLATIASIKAKMQRKLVSADGNNNNSSNNDSSSSLLDAFDVSCDNFFRHLLGDNGTFYNTCFEKPPPYIPPPKLVINKKGVKSLHVGSKIRLWMTDIYALGTITNVYDMGNGNFNNTDNNHCSNKGIFHFSQNHSQQQQQQFINFYDNNLNENSVNMVSMSSNGMNKISTRTSRSPSLKPFLRHENSFNNNDNINKNNENSISSALNNSSPRLFEVTWARDDWVPEVVELYSDDETLDEENPNRWQSLWFPEAPDLKGL